MESILIGSIAAGGKPVSVWAWEKLLAPYFSRKLADYQWTRGRSRYQESIRRLYGMIQILRKPPVFLDEIVAETFLIQRFESRLQDKIGNSILPDSKRSRSETISGLRRVTEGFNIFIQGKPGVGKTTFLKYIALKCADEIIRTGSGINKVPIFIEMKDWAISGLNLMDFISLQFDICRFPADFTVATSLLETGSALVLFDGLDEVSQLTGKRLQQIHEIRNLVRKFHKSQFLITCRNNADLITFENFSYCEVADLTLDQIEKFVENWFRTRPDTHKAFVDELRLERNRRFRELAKTPLFLVFLCWEFDETNSFTGQNTSICEKVINSLISDWDEDQGVVRDEIHSEISCRVEEMYANIAYETFGRSDSRARATNWSEMIATFLEEIPHHTAASKEDSRSILRKLTAQHGILKVTADDACSFSLPSFHEYFVARYIVQNQSASGFSELFNRTEDPEWREVFLFVSGLVSSPLEFFRGFKKVLDATIIEDDQLKAIFSWVDRKASATATNPKSARELYLYVLEARTPGLDLESNNPLRIARDDALDGTRLVMGAGGQSLDLILALTLSLARILTKNLANACDMDVGLERVMDALVEFDKPFDRPYEETIRELYVRAQNQARQLELYELCSQLASLTVPEKGTVVDLSKWTSFEQALRDLVQTHREIGHVWELSLDQAQRLKGYFVANRLFKDCLDCALMPEHLRHDIEKEMFRCGG